MYLFMKLANAAQVIVAAMVFGELGFLADRTLKISRICFVSPNKLDAKIAKRPNLNLFQESFPEFSILPKLTGKIRLIRGICPMVPVFL
jgi:hypothetical protein